MVRTGHESLTLGLLGCRGSTSSSNSKAQQKASNHRKYVKNAEARKNSYDSQRLKIIQQIRLHFGLSRDTKIIIADNVKKQINLNFGKVAVFNSSGTKLICSVEFHHLSSKSGPGQNSIYSHSTPTFNPIAFGTLDNTDLDTLDQDIHKIDTYLSSVCTNPHLVSAHFSESFPILYQHALSCNQVKTNSAMNRWDHLLRVKCLLLGTDLRLWLESIRSVTNTLVRVIFLQIVSKFHLL